MIPIPSAPVAFADGLTLRLPSEACCNCGTHENLSIVTQDTKLTRFMGGGGSEYTFKLDLPFCGGCAKSAKRRPVSLLHRFLVLVLMFFGALALVLAVGMALESTWWLGNAAQLSAAAALVAVVLWYARQRPKDSQTSYYQPVRVVRLRQEFLSGKVKGIGFAMTNDHFARAFRSLNSEMIDSGLVEVRGG